MKILKTYANMIISKYFFNDKEVEKVMNEEEIYNEIEDMSLIELEEYLKDIENSFKEVDHGE